MDGTKKTEACQDSMLNFWVESNRFFLVCGGGGRRWDQS